MLQETKEKDFIAELTNYIHTGSATELSVVAEEKLDESDFEKIRLLKTVEYEKACMILKHLLKKYKSTETKPLILRQAVYYVAYKKLYLKYVDYNKESQKIRNRNNEIKNVLLNMQCIELVENYEFLAVNTYRVHINKILAKFKKEKDSKEDSNEVNLREHMEKSIQKVEKEFTKQLERKYKKQESYDRFIDKCNKSILKCCERLDKDIELRKTQQYIYKKLPSGIQTVVLKNVGLGHNQFTKYGYSVKADFLYDFYKPPTLSIYREGKKRETLQSLISQICARNIKTNTIIVDVFGGTGAVSVGLGTHFYNGVRQIINDKEYGVYAFLKTLSNEPQRLYERCKELLNIDKIEEKMEQADIRQTLIVIARRIEWLSKKVRSEKSLDKAEEHYGELLASVQAFDYGKVFYKKNIEEIEKIINKDDLENFRNDIRSRMLSDEIKELFRALFYYKKFSVYLAGEISEEKLLDIAVAFYYVNAFSTGTRHSGSSITGVKIKSIQEYKKDLKYIVEYGSRFKNIEVRNEDFVSLINEFKDDEKVILYLDPPYYLTKQYKTKFDDECHRRMLDLLKECKCKWMLSCKDELTNKSLKQKAHKHLWGSLYEYYKYLEGDTIGSPKYVFSESNDSDRKGEIIICNFDANIYTKEEIKLFYNVEDKEDTSKVRYSKESYKEFLNRIRE